MAADGTLGGKRGASSSATTGTGTYTVAFANDISACAIQVTEATVTSAGAAAAELAGDKKTVNVQHPRRRGRDWPTGRSTSRSAATSAAERRLASLARA